jgi:hypothetical protein
VFKVIVLLKGEFISQCLLETRLKHVFLYSVSFHAKKSLVLADDKHTHKHDAATTILENMKSGTQ